MSRLARLLDSLRDHGTRPCIEDAGNAYSYAQLLEAMAGWRAELDRRGVQAGTVVALRSDYSLAATAALLALFERHAIAALIPRDRDASSYIADARASLMLDLDTDGTARWEALDAPESHPLLEQLRTAGDGGIVIFTSGSSGRPKAALHSVERFLHKYNRPGRALKTLGFLLFDHIAGLDTLFYTLSAGGTLVLTRRRDPEAILALIESHKVEVLPASPSFLRLLSMYPDDAQRDLSSLKIITYGSEPMDAFTLERLNERFPGVRFGQKYGTTETGSPRTESRSDDSLWVRFKQSEDFQTRVIDNVLWIKSPGTILGYLNAPSPITEDGWYCTGDLVEVDGEWIRFRGRASETINVGGEKVSPAEVEETILELDFVSAVVVSGERHVLMGQIVTARVTVDAEIPAEEVIRRVREHCRAKLAPYKVPIKIDVLDGTLVGARQKAQRTPAPR